MSIPQNVHTEILSQISGIEERENVRIVFAVESGSRAWGFPSPDSDYDVRFVYARTPQDYIRLTPMRDVIELPINDDLDINGWDIQKAINLLLKPNPVLIEWLQSPIRYRWDDKVCEQLIDFAKKLSHDPASSYHYLHLGENNWRANIEGKQNFKLKKYFYVLRPAMALKWLAENPLEIPPMKIQDLMDGVDLNSDLRNVIQNLIERKSQTKEVGLSEPIKVIDDFLYHEFEIAKERLKGLQKPNENYFEEANSLFQHFVFSD